MYTTEHRLHSVHCQCGKKHIGKFPNHVNAYTQYGDVLANRISYLSVEQYMSYDRIQRYCMNVFDLQISEGTIRNILRRVAKKLTPFYELIYSRILRSLIVGSDETGFKVNGGKGWFWVWQNSEWTYIVASKSRGFDCINSQFSEGLPVSTLISDCWSAQLKTKVKDRQICLAHILRDLEYIVQSVDHHWPKNVRSIFHQAIQVKKYSQPSSYPLKQRAGFEEKLKQLILDESFDENIDIRRLRKRLVKNFDAVFCFLKYNEVPFDNNGSERAIRNVKVKQKVSTGYRSNSGAQDFAIIRSVYDTLKKQGKDIMDITSELLK